MLRLKKPSIMQAVSKNLVRLYLKTAKSEVCRCSVRSVGGDKQRLCRVRRTFGSDILDGVTKIGNDAFNGKSIESVVLSQTLQSIGDRAFKGNKLSGAIVFPESLTSIGDEAFSGHGFAEIGLPGTLTSIGQNAFACGEKANLKYLLVPFAGKTKNSGNLIDVFSEKDCRICNISISTAVR